MAREPKLTLDVTQALATPGTRVNQEGTQEGQSNIAKEAVVPNDGIPVVGFPPVVDTSVLATNDPKGDNRPGVIPDAFSPGIDPASNRKIEDMDGRQPIAPAPANGSAAASIEALAKSKKKGGASGTEIRLKADYWPKIENYPEGWERDQTHPNFREYRLPAGTTLTLPAEEVMDLLERGQAERVKP